MSTGLEWAQVGRANVLFRILGGEQGGSVPFAPVLVGGALGWNGAVWAEEGGGGGWRGRVKRLLWRVGWQSEGRFGAGQLGGEGGLEGTMCLLLQVAECHPRNAMVSSTNQRPRRCNKQSLRQASS